MELFRKSAVVPVIAVSTLALAACLHTDDDDGMGEMMTEAPARPSLDVAMATADIVRGTLDGMPYATEQLLGDNGPDSVTKNDQDDDTHTLVIDGGTVREDPMDSDAANDFMMGDAPPGIAGFMGSTHNRVLADLDEVHVVVVYTDKEGASDTDYVDFGFWFLDYAADDHIGYFTHTFARGSMPSGNLSAVTGTASYAGAATGLYVQGTGEDAAAGQFTASAALTADFDAGMIGGTITDFMDADGEALYPSWHVNLLDTSYDADSDRPMARGGTTGGGQWRAEFYGDASAGAPGTVAGTFDAHFSNGHVGGAFAAHEEE